MKNLIRLTLIGAGIAAIAGLYSCENRNNDLVETGTAEFTVSIDLADSKSEPADSSNAVMQVLVSAVDREGKPVFTDKLIAVYGFGASFVSENIEIKAGEYKLTKFMVVDASGKVIFAAPMAGSPMAYLSKKPLPFVFNIVPNQVTRVIPEVLSVGNLTPDQFGYAAFGIQVIKPVEFFAFAIIDNPLIMAPTQMTNAKLTVSAPDGWRYTFMLQPAVNKIVIRGGYANYMLLIEKEGYLAQKFEVSADKLLSHTRENPLMFKFPWNNDVKMISLQPGPDKGKDAMISNLEPDKNFGGHKYFEATFLSEPVLTVMRSNRSLIFFDLGTIPKSAVIRKVVLKLTYDLPIPFDNTVFKPEVYPSAGIAWYGGVLQQVVEPWEESAVTWNNQPKTIEANQVFLAPFIRNTNFIEVDVTKLFVNSAANALPNHGMMFRLWPTDNFPGFRFASSDFPEPSYRPKLNIYYTVN